MAVPFLGLAVHICVLASNSWAPLDMYIYRETNVIFLLGNIARLIELICGLSARRPFPAFSQNPHIIVKVSCVVSSERWIPSRFKWVQKSRASTNGTEDYSMFSSPCISKQLDMYTCWLNANVSMFALIMANTRPGNCEHSLMKLSDMCVPFVSDC